MAEEQTGNKSRKWLILAAVALAIIAVLIYIFIIRNSAEPTSTVPSTAIEILPTDTPDPNLDFNPDNKYALVSIS
jgi:flagellar basal body-associated protein FliL